jgi:signal transduction histidine kinase
VAFILRVTSPLIRRVEVRGEQLRKAHERLRAAASEATLAEERERRKLAIDLHDGIGQLLALANMKLGMLRGSAQAHGLEPQVREVEQLIVEANQRSGSLTFQLCPPVLYDVGLFEASQWLARDLERRYGMKVTIEGNGNHQPLDEATRISLFRSLREALINVAKHAETSEAKVHFSKRGSFLVIAVEDSGVGFSPGRNELGYGLFSISERMNHLGGRVEIESAPGEGTRVVLIAPIGSKREQEDLESA